MSATSRPIQRVGHIGHDDNRFCGAPVFAELAATVTGHVDLVARAFGLRSLSADDREVLRVIALCGTSPDVRVWPLKMARTLASYGSAAAGHFGAQLATVSDRMGPGATSPAAEALRWMLARLDGALDRERVAALIAEHEAAHGSLPGFGVPMRPQDERLLGMYRLIADHPATRRPAWRLHLVVAEVMRGKGIEPNIIIAFAALLADLGLAPHRAGMMIAYLTCQNFFAHSLEAADHDGPVLRELPRRDLDDRSRAPRRSPAAGG